MLVYDYYHLEETTADAVNRYLSEVVSGAVNSLIENSCVEQDPEDPLVLIPTSAGRLASFYYLSHKTIGLFTSAITASTTIAELLYIVSLAEEFALLPVRHAEDETNAILAREMPLPVKGAPESPHTKAHILLQAYLSRRTLELPVSDYVTDTKSVLDQVPRVLQAAIDYCAENGWLVSTLHAILLTQMISQALWLEDSSLLQLPGINSSHLAAFVYPNSGEYIESLPELLEAVQPPPYSRINDLLFDHLSPDLIKPIKQALGQFPVVTVSLDLIGPDPASDSPEAGDCCRPLPIVGLDVAASSESALPVFCDTDYALSVDFRSHVPAALAARSRASTNKAPRGAAPTVKSRDPGWILVLGAVGRNSSSSSGADSCLLALRKISGSQMKHCDTSSRAFTVSFRLDSDLFPPGRLAESVLRLHLYVMSDTYLALDQQLPFELRVLPLPPSCPRRMRAVCDEMEIQPTTIISEFTVRGSTILRLLELFNFQHSYCITKVASPTSILVQESLSGSEYY
ncbi:activating signal cointegrator 1 complex subunit [Sparganum proliferum]